MKTIDKLLTIAYFSSILLIVLMASGDILWIDTCHFYTLNSKSTIIKLLPFGLMSLVGLFYTKIKKIKNFPSLFYIYIPLLTLLYIAPSYSSNLNKNIDSSSHSVNLAIITNISLGQWSHSATYLYEANKKKIKARKKPKLSDLKNLKIGDTILITYSDKCIYMNKIHNLFPTNEEIISFE